jgi:hypothetical protein
MGAAKVNVNPIELLVEIIKEQAPEDIWVGSPVAGYRRLGNSNRGEIGEEFVRRYLLESKIEVTRGIRTALTDVGILKSHLEIKTASLGANGTFQFNHVRLDRKYDFLLCLGICPNDIVFGIWRKGDVAEGRAGTLVRMAEGQSITFKITKKLSEMNPVEKMPREIQRLLARKIRK